MSRNKIDDLLRERQQRFTPLQRLLHHAQNQAIWTADLRALLPAALRNHCRVYDVRGPVVLVSCSNAASATRLRFLAPDLLARLGVLDDFKSAREIRIKVNPET